MYLSCMIRKGLLSDAVFNPSFLVTFNVWLLKVIERVHELIAKWINHWHSWTL